MSEENYKETLEAARAAAVIEDAGRTVDLFERTLLSERKVAVGEAERAQRSIECAERERDVAYRDKRSRQFISLTKSEGHVSDRAVLIPIDVIERFEVWMGNAYVVLDDAKIAVRESIDEIEAQL